MKKHLKFCIVFSHYFMMYYNSNMQLYIVIRGEELACFSIFSLLKKSLKLPDFQNYAVPFLNTQSLKSLYFLGSNRNKL